MIEWPALILKLLPIAEDVLAPGKFKELRNRVGCHELFHDIRKNHHLKRALRLSWISAAQAIVNACKADVEQFHDGALRRQFMNFLPVFNAAMAEVNQAACDLSSKQDLPDSLIDDFVLHFVESMPAHLAFNEGHDGKTYVTNRFLADLHKMTCAPDPLPQVLETRAREGVANGKDKPRTFGTLMFDDFARVLQDPVAYPAANASFLQIQSQIHKELSRENLKLSHRIADLVAGVDQRMDKLLADNPAIWLKDAVIGRLDDIHTEVAGLGDHRQLVETRLSDIHDRLNNLHQLGMSFVEAGVREQPEDFSGAAHWHDPLMQASSVDRARFVHYCLFEDPTRFNQIRNVFHRVLENLRVDVALDLLPWHVPSIEHRGRQMPQYLHNAIAKHSGEPHGGTVIELGTNLGDSLSCDQTFVDKLFALRWHEEGGAGVNVTLGNDQGKRSIAARRGVFPLTVVSQLALSTLMQGKSLRILLRVKRADVSGPTACFLAFMETLSVPVEQVDPLQNDTTWVLRYLQTLLGINPTYIENPYPRLEHYTVEHAGHYHGREAECELALDLLAQRRQSGQPAVLGVRGPSGCGKSSFVQAGLVATLMEKGYKSLTLRRTDMLGQDGESVIAARQLSDRMRFALGQPEADEIATLYEGQPQFVVPSCGHYLSKLHRKAGEPALVICIDQFEEIVDDLADEKHVDEWTSLLGIVDQLASIPKVAIVFTLEDSRFDKLASQVNGSVLGNPAWLKLSDGQPSFLRTIVQAPLREAGFELEEAIVDQLVNEAIDLDQTNGDIGSPLPLLSLKMHNLFREIRARGLEGNIDAPEKIDLNALRGMSLSIAEEIESLAEEAWVRSGATDADVGHFLRPLVRLSKSDAEGARTNIVLGAVKAREFSTEKTVDKEFSRLRLLVPAAGGWRLVHESVIHRWKRSAQWFAETRDELSREAALRMEAEAWHALGRPACSRDQLADLGAAVLVLQAHIRNWATDLPLDLPDGERHLLDYASALFGLSDTPLEPVPSSQRGSLHVHLAASYGCMELLRHFARLDPSSLHVKTKQERLPLHCAAFSQAEATAYLLAQNADMHHIDDDGATALDIATYVQREDIVDLVLNSVAGTPQNALPGSPLFSAAQVGHLEIVRKLEAAGYSHAVTNKKKWTPLHYAATNDNIEVFRHFLARGNVEAENDDALTPIDVAAANGHWKLVQAALGHKATAKVLAGARSSGWTTLSLAAHFRRYKTVEMLVPICDPNVTFDKPGAFEGYTALHLALHDFNKDRESAPQRLRNHTARTAEALLSSARTDVLIRAKEKSAYEMAKGLSAIQSAILAHPTFDPLRPMDKGWTELMLAAKSGDRDQVNLLFEHIKTRENIDHISEDGYSLALLLLQSGMVDLVKPLLEAKEVNPWKTERGYPGLLVAADTDATPEIHRWILETIPDRVSPQMTARILFNLITRDHTKDTEGAMAESVLERTDLTADTSALSATMIGAVRFGRLDMFALLEKYGIEPALPDEWGRRIEDLASDVVREALLNRGRLLS